MRMAGDETQPTRYTSLDGKLHFLGLISFKFPELGIRVSTLRDIPIEAHLDSRQGPPLGLGQGNG